jgi:hypothetical protein
MSKVRCKVKKMQALGANDEKIAEIFNQLLRNGDVNLAIAYPRYIHIKNICSQLVKMFAMLADGPFMRNYKQFGADKAEITAFCESSAREIDRLFAITFTDEEWKGNTPDEPRKKAFSEASEVMRGSDLINTFIILCDRLVPYKKNFADRAKLNHKFIINMAGVEWRPFPFTQLNFKEIFALDLTEGTIEFFMALLHKSFDLSYSLYNEISTPDIDVDQFVDIIVKSIDEIKKRPELSRCDRAFAKMKESVALLKSRFNGYYRDYITTKDSTIMMQHFVLDVSKQTTKDAKTMQQFQKIIGYYRKIASQSITNPNVKLIFEKIDQSFKLLERGTSNLVNIRDTDDDSGSGGDAASPDGATELIHDPADNEADAIAAANARRPIDELVAEINAAGELELGPNSRRKKGIKN